MKEYIVTRNEQYLMHKRNRGNVKQTDLDGDGKLEWTEYGKQWRRDQYQAQKESRALPHQREKDILDIAGDALKVTDKNDVESLSKAEDKIEKGIKSIGSTVESIHEGKKYDAAREKLLNKASKMSDEELRTITNRLNLERSYANAMMGEGKKGKVTFNRVMEIIGGTTALAAGAGAITYTVLGIIEKAKNLSAG